MKGTKTFGLKFESGNQTLSMSVDLDFAGDQENRKSTTGYTVKVGEALVCWASKKQKSVALSTCEAEYYAISISGQEIFWLRRVFAEVGIALEGPTTIWSDNQSAIMWAVGEKGAEIRAKHIDTRVQDIRELIRNNTICVKCVPTDVNDADMMTKPLSKKKHWKVTGRVQVMEVIEEEC